jgi:hypothetical protein
MVKKLEIEALTSDLATTLSLLESARHNHDFIGEAQLTERSDGLSLQLQQLEESPERVASVALFFGGRPVLGSRGVDAKFASDALESYQSLVAKHFASMEFDDALGARGRIRASSEAKLMVTDVARGSFGFLMEEAPEQSQIVETKVGEAIESLSAAMSKLSSTDDDWSDAVGTLDQRVVSAVHRFFEVLDEADATVRIVEGAHDRLLSADDVKRARLRTENTSISEVETDFIEGQIVGFSSKVFEFAYSNGERVSGRIENGPARKIAEAGESGHIQSLLFTTVKAKFRVRTLTQANWMRTYHTLIAIDDRADSLRSH